MNDDKQESPVIFVIKQVMLKKKGNIKDNDQIVIVALKTLKSQFKLSSKFGELSMCASIISIMAYSGRAYQRTKDTALDPYLVCI